jgi:hypothetical protein
MPFITKSTWSVSSELDLEFETAGTVTQLFYQLMGSDYNTFIDYRDQALASGTTSGLAIKHTLDPDTRIYVRMREFTEQAAAQQYQDNLHQLFENNVPRNGDAVFVLVSQEVVEGSIDSIDS